MVVEKKSPEDAIPLLFCWQTITSSFLPFTLVEHKN